MVGAAMEAHVERLVPMTRTASQPSRRLLAAAAAERESLRRQRADLLAQRDRLRAEIAELEAELVEIEQRDELLGRLSADDNASGIAISSTQKTAAAVADTEHRRALRGPAIRQTAVQVLLADPRGPEALHYREWFALVQDAGYAVAGKDPLAVFLTQISRSPVVRRGTQSGVYELDHTAVARLRHQLDDRQAQLRSLTAATSPAATLSDVRGQRNALNLEIDRLEKAIEEAETLLGPEPPRLAATG
jgi:chromosome segregation ATPase